MKKIVYINGSPRKADISSSARILKDLAFVIRGENGSETDFLTLPLKTGQDQEQLFRRMDEADVMVFAFPLYIDTLPGHMTWWLKQYENHIQKRGRSGQVRVYGVCNCGFPEAVQCRDALKILEIFCLKNSLSWRMGLGIGKGTPYGQMKDIPLKSIIKSGILKAFQEIAADLNDDNPEQDDPREMLTASIRFPGWAYRLMGSVEWKSQAKKHGVSKKDIYARPLVS